MPRVIRRAKKRSAGYDEDHVRHLLHGVALCPGSGFRTYGHESDYEAMRVAWGILRDQLLTAWIAEHPGCRPFAWWKFDAVERRQRTNGIPHPFDNQVRRKQVETMARKAPTFEAIAYELYYGRPRALVVRDDFDAHYETEPEYLQRLGLLTESEVEALAT